MDTGRHGGRQMTYSINPVCKNSGMEISTEWDHLQNSESLYLMETSTRITHQMPKVGNIISCFGHKCGKKRKQYCNIHAEKVSEMLQPTLEVSSFQMARIEEVNSPEAWWTKIYKCCNCWTQPHPRWRGEWRVACMGFISARAMDDLRVCEGTVNAKQCHLFFFCTADSNYFSKAAILQS